MQKADLKYIKNASELYAFENENIFGTPCVYDI